MLNRTPPIPKSKRHRHFYLVKISSKQIADLLGISLNTLNKRIQRHNLQFKTSNPWIGFWNLVLYLEKNGLRPECIENQLDN